MKIRSEFLLESLIIEATISQMLASLLGVKEYESSKSLGNTSTALSYNAKVLLFLDLKIIDPKEYWKFQKFMEIRNQFMHNLDAYSYEKCFEYVKGAEEKLKKEYPKISLKTRELFFQKLALKLAEDVSQICKKVAKSVTEVKMQALYSKVYTQSTKTMLDIINQLKDKSQDSDLISSRELLQEHQKQMLEFVRNLNSEDHV